VAHVHRFSDVETFGQRRQVSGIVVHIMATVSLL